MKAISQEYNDNVGNEETELCFNCRTYKTIDEFNAPEGKNICKGCFNKYKKLCKKLKVEFIEIPGREARSLTRTYTITDVYCVIGKKRIFIRGYEEQKGNDIERANIFEIKNQFLESGLKYFTFHCGAWVDELKTNEKISPIEFIKWLKKNNYNFGVNYDCSIEYLKSYDLYDFSGNLEEVSCAFNFRIYDKKYYKEIVEILKDSYFKHIKVKGDKK